MKGAAAPGVSSSQPPVNQLLTLREIDLVEDPGERRRLMLDRLEAIKELAKGRSYTNKHGDVVAMPDAGTMLRVDEVALELLGVSASTGVRKPADLSVFNGGKSPQKATG